MFNVYSYRKKITSDLEKAISCVFNVFKQSFYIHVSSYDLNSRSKYVRAKITKITII